ncbi:MAG: class I SAM-dependent methyltransferase [Planctomycetota bacterium]
MIGCDFAHAMLMWAAQHPSKSPLCLEADALRLPLADGAVTVVGCAFGVRNFESLDRGLAEMYRVLAGDGRAVILEFTRPSNGLVRAMYELYAGRVMPRLASWLSRDHTGAYRYLPRSVVSFVDARLMCDLVSFVDARLMCDRLIEAGFCEAQATPLTCGVVTVYVARKASDG